MLPRARHRAPGQPEACGTVRAPTLGETLSSPTIGVLRARNAGDQCHGLRRTIRLDCCTMQHHAVPASGSGPARAPLRCVGGVGQACAACACRSRGICVTLGHRHRRSSEAPMPPVASQHVRRWHCNAPPSRPVHVLCNHAVRWRDVMLVRDGIARCSRVIVADVRIVRRRAGFLAGLRRASFSRRRSGTGPSHRVWLRHQSQTDHADTRCAADLAGSM